MIKILKLISLLLLTITILISSSGCIDIHWPAGFLGEEEPPLSYHIDHKWSLHYNFEAGPHEDDLPIHVNKGTIWMKINITVSMESSAGLIRYVQVLIEEPGESPGETKEYYSRKYNTTKEDNIVINDPAPGEWKFHIEGTGISISDIQDGYSVEVTTYEPDRGS